MKIKFSELLHAKYANKEVNVKAIVSGKSSPYTIPKVVEITCRKNSECFEHCKAKNAESFTIDDTSSILKFIDVNEASFNKTIQGINKIACEEFTYKVRTSQNIEKIFVSAPTGKERVKNSLTYTCYFLGYDIDVNNTYELKGTPTNNPKTQESTCVFTEAKKTKTDVESFTLTKEIRNSLNEFARPDTGADGIMIYLDELYESYSSNITKIFGRMDLHMAVDMVFHSPLKFKFDAEIVHKGWVDAAIIGDTRCGKGYVAENLLKYYEVGEVTSGDNASFAGIVGGLQQFSNNKWQMSWGKIPLNDQGLVIIDEAGEIRPEDMSRLTRIRSEGIAEITKIQSHITNARTRLLMLMNPPGKMISNYSYGIQSLSDVFKNPEDIARFDFALVVAHGEVSIDDINKSRTMLPEIYPKELEQKLIMWIWSRKQSDIVFTDEAIDRVYKCAKAISKIYTFAMPLIQGENVRLKLAKLAICFAGRMYSNKAGGRILHVGTHHVDCAWIFLNSIYKKEPAGYQQMSALQRVFDEGASEENIASINSYFRTFGNKQPRLIKCFLVNSGITVRDLIEQINIPDNVAHEMISKLLDKGMMIKKGPVYVKTPGFTSWIKRLSIDKIK